LSRPCAFPGGVPTDAAAEAAVAAGRVQRPAGIDDETERRVGLLAAVDEVRHLARADEVMTVLRLLWADQGLEEQLRLQRRLREIYVTAAPGAAPATLG
jgi:hypothetical protein